MARLKSLLLFFVLPVASHALSWPAIEVDYLYWGMWNNEVLWANSIAPAPAIGAEDSSEFFYSCPDFQSGVRGVASLDLCGSCMRLTGRYYWVSYHASGRRVNPGDAILRISSTVALNAGAVATTRSEMPYHSADLFVDWCVLGRDCVRLFLQAGGTFAFAKQTTRTRLFDGSSDFVARTRNRFAGGGPRVGLLGEVDVSCAFSLAAELGVAGVIGEQANAWFDNNASFGSVPVAYSLQTATSLAAHLQMRLGGQYRQEFNRACLGFNIGWEHRSYFNLSSPITGLAERIAAANVAQEGLIFDLTVGGPYIGLTVDF